MATYIVGDLQGCFDELQKLLDRVEFDKNSDQLWLVGDLVARGRKSLECLRFAKDLGEACKIVLGNHDLHLIATALGIKKVKERDYTQAILDASDCNELIEWLRCQPLLQEHEEFGFIMVHAGISPDWGINKAKKYAKEVSDILKYGDYRSLIENMYENSPDRWSKSLVGIDRYRYIINAFTRMRYCYKDHRLDFECKVGLKDAPDKLKPWFKMRKSSVKRTDIIFGHWASLVGEGMPEKVYAMDSGCVWGHYMTMLRWEDQQYFIQDAIKNDTSADS